MKNNPSIYKCPHFNLIREYLVKNICNENLSDTRDLIHSLFEIAHELEMLKIGVVYEKSIIKPYKTEKILSSEEAKIQANNYF